MSMALAESEARDLEVKLDQQRKKLLEVYGNALDKALAIADGLKDAIERLIEVDASMLSCLYDVEESETGAHGNAWIQRD